MSRWGGTAGQCESRSFCCSVPGERLFTVHTRRRVRCSSPECRCGWSLLSCQRISLFRSLSQSSYISLSLCFQQTATSWLSSCPWPIAPATPLSSTVRHRARLELQAVLLSCPEACPDIELAKITKERKGESWPRRRYVFVVKLVPGAGSARCEVRVVLIKKW